MIKLNTIEEAIEDIKNGKIIIVVDDEDRENEGDFLAAAELVTPEVINFMSINGRGLICTPIPESICNNLQLDMMVGNNTDPSGTAFTVSIDLLGGGVTTGISAYDRATTISALMDSKITAKDFSRPGHVFPLRAKEGGVLRRPGHTEAAVDLAKLAGLEPGGVIVEIMNEDGSMARLPELMEIAKKFDLKIISIADLISYRLKHDSLIKRIFEMPLSTSLGEYKLIVYEQKTNLQVHFALVKGEWMKEEEVLVRVKSSNAYFNLFISILNGEQSDLRAISKMIEEEGHGAIIFINNLINAETITKKLEEYKSYFSGEPNTIKMDSKDYGIGAQIIKDLGINKVKLITKSTKIPKLISSYGLEITKQINIQ